MIVLKNGDLGLRMRINSHWIFSDIVYDMSFLPDYKEYLEEIDPLVGLSPNLLTFYAAVTGELLEPKPVEAQKVDWYEQLIKVRQHLPDFENLSDRERKILKDCASAYLHRAFIYVLCCFEG